MNKRQPRMNDFKFLLSLIFQLRDLFYTKHFINNELVRYLDRYLRNIHT